MPPEMSAAGHVPHPASPLRVETEPNPAAWDGYVRAHPDATLFHAPSWGRVIERTFPGFRAHHRIAVREGKICGVLPLYAVPGFPVGSALISTPLGVYGGVCADDEEATQILLDDAAALADRLGSAYVELRHRRPIGSLPTKDLYVCFEREVHPNHDVNFKAIEGKRRRGIRMAEQHGLTFREGGLELLDTFYAVYTQNMRNLGSPAFPQRLFRNLLEEYGPQCRIFGVFHGSVMTSGSLTLLYRDRIMPYYSASTPEGMTVSTNEFMYWNIMCYAADRGIAIFDFGRSKKKSGSYDFKRFWGFVPKPLAYQYQLMARQEMPDLSPSNPKYAWLIWTWQRMPLPLTRWLGPKLSRYFP